MDANPSLSPSNLNPSTRQTSFGSGLKPLNPGIVLATEEWRKTVPLDGPPAGTLALKRTMCSVFGRWGLFSTGPGKPPRSESQGPPTLSKCPSLPAQRRREGKMVDGGMELHTGGHEPGKKSTRDHVVHFSILESEEKLCIPSLALEPLVVSALPPEFGQNAFIKPRVKHGLTRTLVYPTPLPWLGDSGTNLDHGLQRYWCLPYAGSIRSFSPPNPSVSTGQKWASRPSEESNDSAASPRALRRPTRRRHFVQQGRWTGVRQLCVGRTLIALPLPGTAMNSAKERERKRARVTIDNIGVFVLGNPDGAWGALAQASTLRPSLSRMRPLPPLPCELNLRTIDTDEFLAGRPWNCHG